MLSLLAITFKVKVSASHTIQKIENLDKLLQKFLSELKFGF